MIARLPQKRFSSAIDRLIARHGVMPVLMGLIVALIRRPRRRPKPPDANGLSSYLRRDIGLPPSPPGRQYWDHL